MRALLLAPLAVVVVAAGGVALMLGTGRATHAPALINAAGTCLIATALAALHLFVTIGVAMAMLLFGRLSQPFLYWLIPMYFATLIPIVIGATRAVRQAPREPSPTLKP